MADLNKVMLIGRLTDDPEAPRTFAERWQGWPSFGSPWAEPQEEPTDGAVGERPQPLYIDCEAFNADRNCTNLVDVIYAVLPEGRPNPCRRPTATGHVG